MSADRQRIKMLEDELLMAVRSCDEQRREVTRLSNYETSYNNLQSVVNSQYRNIDALTGELAEARARLRKANCDYGDGWLSDDLECGRDVEPWCGKHAVLYYIKENKEAGGRFMITLGEQADRIAELEDNNRILRDGWTADNKKLMDVLAALPAIIFGVVYYDLGEHGITWKVCVERWKRYWAPALAQEHSGDCTNECHSCARCQAEDVMRLAGIVRKGLDDGE